MVQICNFRSREPVRLDPDRLIVLYAELGDYAAERVISAAMEDLAVQLAQVEVAAREGRVEALSQGVSALGLLARQVGMVQLGQVARHLEDCVVRGDRVAQAAVLSRLLRTGQGSLSAVWDLADMRG